MKKDNNHLKGKGNGDVYADFKYGSNLTIQIILELFVIVLLSLRVKLFLICEMAQTIYIFL